MYFFTRQLKNNVVERSASSTDADVIAAAVVIPTVLIIIIVTLVIAILVWLRLHTKITEEFTIDKMTKAYQAASHPLFDRMEPPKQAGPHEKEFSSENISFARELGEGAFGRVYQGIATKIITGEDSTVVAVKQLKSNTSVNDDGAVEDFFKG